MKGVHGKANEENEWDHRILATVKEGPADCIKMDKVAAALKRMKRHKAPDLSGLVAEMIQTARDIGTQWIQFGEDVVVVVVVSALLSINIVTVHVMDLSPGPCVGLSVGGSVRLSVRKVYCGRKADWIWMPFGMVSRVGRGMGVLDGGPSAAR